MGCLGASFRGSIESAALLSLMRVSVRNREQKSGRSDPG